MDHQAEQKLDIEMDAVFLWCMGLKALNPPIAIIVESTGGL